MTENSTPADSASATNGDGVQWWETRWLIGLVAGLALLPFLRPQFPALVDLPGHMGRYRVALDIHRSAELKQLFEFRWELMGNLGVDVLVLALSQFIGLELAVKLIVGLIPALTIVGFLWLAREVHGRIPATALFAVPFAFGYPFQFGFVNYSLGVALAFNASALWIHLGKKGCKLRRALCFVPLSSIIFLCHAYAWGVLGLLIFGIEVGRQRPTLTDWKAPIVRAFAHVIPLTPPFLLMWLWRSGVVSNIGPFFNARDKLSAAVSALRDRWMYFDLISVGLVTALIIWAWASPSRKLNALLAIPTLILAGAFLIIPGGLLGSGYADMRLAPFVFALAILSIAVPYERTSRMSALIAASAVTFAAMRILATTASQDYYARTQENRLLVIDYLPVGAKVVNLVGVQCKGQWPLWRNSHLGALAIVRRYAFSNDQWVVPGANGLRPILAGAEPFNADPSEVIKPDGCDIPYLRTFDEAVAALPTGVFTHIWLIDIDARPQQLPIDATLVRRSDGSALYRLSDRVADQNLKAE